MSREKSGKAEVKEKAGSRYKAMIWSFDFILCEVGSLLESFIEETGII